MNQKPVPPKASIVDYEMKFLITLVSILTGALALGIFYYTWKTSGDLDRARTMTFAAVAVDSLLYVFSCRSLRYSIFNKQFFSNKYLLVAVGLGFILQLVAVYTPFFQRIFHTVSLTLADWGIVISLGVVAIVAIEVVKWGFIRYQAKRSTVSVHS